jgi:L-fucose isomerase-like protein
MNQKKDLVIGYLPTARNFRNKDIVLKYKEKILKTVRSFGYTFIDIDDIIPEGLLIAESDSTKVIEKFINIKVDAVFGAHCDFGSEVAVSKVAKEINKPFLLWGPRDEAPSKDGIRSRSTQCGLFATSKALIRNKVRFSYIINCKLEDERFKKEFNNFARVVNIVKTLKNLKIGQIGTRPEPFNTVICNEGELLEKFGISVIPFNLEDIINLAKGVIDNPNSEYNCNYNIIKKLINNNAADDSIRLMAALKTTINSISIAQNISAFALQCWPTLPQTKGILPCLINSLLFDEKIPVACETDVKGAITSIIAQAACFNEKPVFLADLTIRHPAEDNTELLWHCGSFPYSLKKKGSKAKISKHPTMKNSPFGVCEWELKDGDISIIRFDEADNNYSLFVGEGKTTNGPYNTGTYVWIEVNDWEKWERKLIFGPYIHHVACIYDKITEVLHEACKYIDGLELDPVDFNN